MPVQSMRVFFFCTTASNKSDIITFEMESHSLVATKYADTSVMVSEFQQFLFTSF